MPSDEALRNFQRHRAAQRRMQSGVALDLVDNPETPKHLRVGVNTALTDHASLVGLLVSKGVITDEEYSKAIADGMEKEAERYEKLLSDRYHRPITLGAAGLDGGLIGGIGERFEPPGPSADFDGGDRTTTDGKPPRPGFENGPAPAPIDPASGQHEAYYVLSEAERAKGFVRPVRQSYRHVGPPGPKHPLRDLTPEEHERYDQYGYVKFEAYTESEGSVTGRFWTQTDLDRVTKGCGVVTTMGTAIAETYARNPKFYGATFCCGCRNHFPVGEAGEFVWEGTNERVGT